MKDLHVLSLAVWNVCQIDLEKLSNLMLNKGRFGDV